MIVVTAARPYRIETRIENRVRTLSPKRRKKLLRPPSAAIVPAAPLCCHRWRRPVLQDAAGMRTHLVLTLTTALLAALPVLARTPAPANAQVYFIWPSDGMVIRQGFWVRMGLRNMGVAPKGTAIANTGHHHLLIDADLPEKMDEPVPSDRSHLHFGAGETEARIELPPGRHTLQLLLADKDHIPHDPPIYSKKITVTVK
jgi:hypothetical protein